MMSSDIDFVKSMKKAGYIVDVVEDGNVVTKLTPAGAEVHAILSMFVDGKPGSIKTKRNGVKADDVMLKIVKFGKGMNQLMEGLGKMGGTPVKMDMSSMVGFGMPNTKKPKRKMRKKRANNGKVQ